MTILITELGQYISTSPDEPEVGASYQLEDIAKGTLAQGRAFHALAQEYYKSGLWSYQGSGYKQCATFMEFRDLVKRKLGAGFEMYFYVDIVDGLPVARKVKHREDIPERILTDPRAKEMIFGRLKSWTDYTKRERMAAIDAIIAEMIQVGVNSKKFHEIMDGLEKAR